jgi:hypothetical protein
MICSVRNVAPEEIILLKNYRDSLVSEGIRVYHLAESTDQDDKSGGYQICENHCGTNFRWHRTYVPGEHKSNNPKSL